jgi:hypothetical protein
MATEFTIQLPDRPGALADLAEVLAGQGINIMAIHATPCPSEGIVQFIPNNIDATVEALRNAQLDYTAKEVLLVSLADQPGMLARLARALGNAGINIDALYITLQGQVVLDVSDLREAQKVVLGLGIK